ncbi:hypothetical protein PN441_18040 [Spirulina major CS-329]|uniref:hypothetical protein n=1 Tax=Spirulina TaxID=1154 RepID=UPI0023313E8C|nr:MULTISPECIES: hypothetical protein [Spirulina]MDB9496819.1 hypothetical protein [Spirulina subsalsa CS-330]MDB9504982.1 hypothetical protein [Spirulina major CS-329]
MRLAMKLWVGVLTGALCVVLPGLDVAQRSQVAIAQTAEDQQSQAERLVKAGGENLKSGNYQAALTGLQQAYAIYREIEDGAGMVQAALLSGYALVGLGETERARGIFQGLLDLAIDSDFQWLEDQARKGLQVVQRAAAQ